MTRRDGRTPGRLPPNRFHEAAWIVGPGKNFDIADDVWIGAFCVIDGAHDKLIIGPGSVVAAGAHVYTHSTVKRTRGDGKLEHAPTMIGARVSICANAVVLMGCRIRDGAVVGAGAVVLEGTVIPTGETWGGVPARRLDVPPHDPYNLTDEELAAMCRAHAPSTPTRRAATSPAFVGMHSLRLIAPGETVEMSVVPQVVFKPMRLYVVGECGAFSLLDLAVGMESVFPNREPVAALPFTSGSGEVFALIRKRLAAGDWRVRLLGRLAGGIADFPAEALADVPLGLEVSVGDELGQAVSAKTCLPSMAIRINVRNDDNRALPFRAALFGATLRKETR